MQQTEPALSLAHYAQLARTPGWKDHCWHMVKQMAKDDPSLFGTLPALLVAAMKAG